MKYIIILADGMADFPLPELGYKTPLEYANTPAMDALAMSGLVGLVRTVPKSLKPGSDVANLSVLGFDPEKYYSGRSSLEALGIGVELEQGDVAFRCNLVTLSENEPYSEKTLLDHSAGEISTCEAAELMAAIQDAFHANGILFYPGTGYRQIAIWPGGEMPSLEAPHDHLGQPVGSFLPHQPLLRRMMEESYRVLNHHPVNLRRQAEGKQKANSLWFWGAGSKPCLDDFYHKYGINGAMISAVDLLKGIALGCGLTCVNVDGATGSLNTNYRGKAEAALRVLRGADSDFVFLHVEAPDEMGHQGDVHKKISAIEYIDAQVISYIKRQLEKENIPFRMLVMPDHATPVELRTHTSDPVPFVLYDSVHPVDGIPQFSERDARGTGLFEPFGYKLIERLIE